MPSLLAEAMERQGAMVATWTKLAQQRRPSAQLPDIGARLVNKQQSLFGYQGSAADKYQYFKDWVYVAIHCIADRVAALAWEAGEITNAGENPERSFNRRLQKIPARVQQKANSSQEIKSIASHPVLDLLARPNSLQHKYEFLYFTVANLEIAGKVYWIVGKDDDSDEEAIYAVPVHWMEYKSDQKLYKFKPRSDVEGVDVPAEFVTQAYFPNPSDPGSWYSPLVACFSAVRIDRYIQGSQDQTFQRGIHPNLIVTVGADPGTGKRPQLTGAQRRQFIRAIREVLSQTVNIGDPVILDSLIESVHKLHLTPQEMDWPASGEIVKKRIFQTYRVNPYVVGEVTGVNKAQAVVAEQTFNTQVVNPIGGSVSEMATDFLGPRYETPKRLLVYLEQAITEDPDQLLRTWATLRRNGDVTQDEIRSAVLGLAPLDQRDDQSNITQLVGGFTGVLSLLQQVNYGLIGIDQAIALLTRYLRISEEDAVAIIGKPVIRFQQPPQGQLSLPSPVEASFEWQYKKQHPGNPSHEPAGSPEGGQFAEGGGGSGSGGGWSAPSGVAKLSGHDSYAKPAEREKADAVVNTLSGATENLKSRYSKLKNMEIPEVEMQNLSSVKAEFVTEKSGVAGAYERSKGKITLAADEASMNEKDAVTLGSFRATSGMTGTYLHEAGHHVWYGHTTEKAKNDMVKIFRDMKNKKNFPSSYASTSKEELFAEGFAVYTHPSYRGQLPKPLHDFYEGVLKPKKKELVI